MKLKLVIVFLIICVTTVDAQNKVDSKPILDKTSQINSGYKTISSDFTFKSGTLQQPDNSITENGKIYIKGTKYKLILEKSQIIFDGKALYNYVPESNEVNITNPEPTKIEKGDFFISNPRDVFSFYTKNFKNKWINEVNVKGKLYHEIDLYPNDLKTKYTRITMHIEKNSYQILDITLFLKNGDRQSVEFSNFQANKNLPDSDFEFDTKKYPGIVVNDMRF